MPEILLGSLTAENTPEMRRAAGDGELKMRRATGDAELKMRRATGDGELTMRRAALEVGGESATRRALPGADGAPVRDDRGAAGWCRTSHARSFGHAIRFT